MVNEMCPQGRALWTLKLMDHIDMSENNIRILYDELGFFEPHGGVSRLFTEVMRNLPQGFEWRLSPVCTGNAYLQEPPFCLPSAKESVHDFIRNTLHGHSFPGVSHVYKMLGRIFPERFPSGELANARSRVKLLRAGDFDVFHTTTPHPMFNSWSSAVGKKPIVTTVVDLIPEILGNSRRVRHFRKQLLQKSDHIIAITECTKRDLMRLYDVNEEKISVVYLGYNMPLEGNQHESIDLEVRWGLKTRQFLLFVGKRGGYKNFTWMVQSLAPLLKDGLKLFCTGSPFSAQEKTLLSRLGVEGQVVQSFVSDLEMRALFGNALAFIHPSIYEGFGIPILDAFAAGCPAVLANASCFPEVAGGAALYFDPHEEGTFRAQIEKLSRSIDLRDALVGKGYDRVREFSWRKCAQETADVYARLVR